jgi:hypothetical protein
VEKETTHLNHDTSPFLSDGAKLTRILAVIEERVTSRGGQFKPDFEVTLKNGTTLKVSTLEELLKFDNTIKNPVTALEIGVDTEELDAHVTVDDSVSKNISIGVRGSQPKLVGELFAELEEQLSGRWSGDGWRGFLDRRRLRIRLRFW